MSTGKLCFCLAGWHFHEQVYSRLAGVRQADIYVISHRPCEDVPKAVQSVITSDHFIFEKNLGYDWGCYQQFLARQLWKEYNLIFFLHDDLRIENLDFIPHTFDLLNSGAVIVGNGLNSPFDQWPRTHLFCYAHSAWIPPSLDFTHNTVRGSFFAVQPQTLERLEKFEVFWDPKKFHVRFGNHSLIATCGKLASLFGPDSFAFLGSEYRASPYILEMERGGKESARSPGIIANLVIALYNRMGRAEVLRRMYRPSDKQELSTQLIRRTLEAINGSGYRP